VSDQLSQVRLSSVEASGLSLAGLAPTMAMALGTAFAASEAGPAVPFSYLLAMIGSFSLAYVIVRYARRYDVASGVAFTYAGKSLGRLAGFLAGWVYVTAWLSGTAVVLAIASVSTQALLARHGANISWFWIFVILLLVVTAVNYLGVKPSVRVLVALELLSMLTLAGVMIHVLAVGGAGGLSWKPFDPSLSPKGLSGIGYGMIYGFAGFAGFEAAAALGRDSSDPGRVILRALDRLRRQPRRDVGERRRAAGHDHGSLFRIDLGADHRRDGGRERVLLRSRADGAHLPGPVRYRKPRTGARGVLPTPSALCHAVRRNRLRRRGRTRAGAGRRRGV
jgi:hypothetical protein